MKGTVPPSSRSSIAAIKLFSETFSVCEMWTRISAGKDLSAVMRVENPMITGAGFAYARVVDFLSTLEQTKLPFADLLGIRFLNATKDEVRAEMIVKDELCTRPAVLHGGALMTLAD